MNRYNARVLEHARVLAEHTNLQTRKLTLSESRYSLTTIPASGMWRLSPVSVLSRSTCAVSTVDANSKGRERRGSRSWTKEQQSVVRGPENVCNGEAASASRASGLLAALKMLTREERFGPRLGRAGDWSHHRGAGVDTHGCCTDLARPWKGYVEGGGGASAVDWDADSRLKKRARRGGLSLRRDPPAAPCTSWLSTGPSRSSPCPSIVTRRWHLAFPMCRDLAQLARRPSTMSRHTDSLESRPPEKWCCMIPDTICSQSSGASASCLGARLFVYVHSVALSFRSTSFLLRRTCGPRRQTFRLGTEGTVQTSALCS